MQVSMPSASTSTLSMLERVEIVLVPLDDGAVLHGRVLDRHHLAERAPGQHEAADVLGQVAREADQLAASQRPGALSADPSGSRPSLAEHRSGRTPSPDQPQTGLAERRVHVLRQAHGLGDLAHGALGPIADDRGGEAGTVAAVRARRCTGSPPRGARARSRRRCRAARCARRETKRSNSRSMRDGIDGGDAQHVADRRVGGRAAALAENAVDFGRSGRCRGR